MTNGPQNAGHLTGAANLRISEGVLVQTGNWCAGGGGGGGGYARGGGGGIFSIHSAAYGGDGAGGPLEYYLAGGGGGGGGSSHVDSSVTAAQRSHLGNGGGPQAVGSAGWVAITFRSTETPTGTGVVFTQV